MKTSESYAEGILRDGIKRLGGIAYKFVSPGNNGVPDRLIVLPNGEVCFVEMKAVGGRVSPVQKRQFERLNSLWRPVRVLYGADDVRAFLAELETRL